MLYGIGPLSPIDFATESTVPSPPMEVAIESAAPLEMDATTESDASPPMVTMDGSPARL
jgi:hypothetical protein